MSGDLAPNLPDLERSAGDIDFYSRLALEAKPPVLELGCGEGRVAAAFAGAGVRTVGIDCNRPALVNAAHRSAHIPGLAWVLGDMCRLPFAGPFGLVVIPYRGFSCLPDEESQRAALAGVRALLGNDGLLAFDLFNPGVVDLLTRRLAGLSPAPNRRLRSLSPDGPVLRLLSRAGTEAMLQEAGYEVEALYGGFDGTPFREGSTTMVWLARGG